MKKILFSLVAALLSCLYANAQMIPFDTVQLRNTSYYNIITSALYSGNAFSGLIFQSNGSINYGMTGDKGTPFKFRWLAHDSGAIDYSASTDQIMSLDNNGNLNTKGTLTTGNSVGIGTAPGPDKLTIDMGATRSGINMLSDGDAAAYSDFKFSVKTNTSIATGKPTSWQASFRKDGYFSDDATGPTLEFYALRKNIAGAYFAPLLFKSNGDVIIAGANANAINGNVGIGTTDTKGYKLAVNGDAMFTRIKVKAYGTWPDYVFGENYNLLPLQELEAYVKKHNHLPDVPSAEEVTKEGMDVAQMNKILLQKIEELTLHLIEMQKEINQLKENRNK